MMYDAAEDTARIRVQAECGVVDLSILRDQDYCMSVILTPECARRFAGEILIIADKAESQMPRLG